jgi:hypothetical protein
MLCKCIKHFSNTMSFRGGDMLCVCSEASFRDVPPCSVAERFGVLRHCNDPLGQPLCMLGGHQPAQ